MMMMGIYQWQILVLAISLHSYSNAESIIAIDMGNTKGSRDTSLTASASVTIDDDDLFSMPKITFTGMGDDEDAAVYTKTEASSRTMDSGAKETVWRGVIDDEDGHGFATLIRDDDGNVFGTFTTKLAAYDLLNIPGQNPQVRTILWENAKEGTGIVEGEPLSAKGIIEELNQDVAMDGSFEPDHSGIIVTTMGEEAVMLENGNRKLIRSGDKRNLQGNPVVDILIVVTNRARCEWAGLASGCAFTDEYTRPIKDEIAVLQTVTNDAMSGVGIGASVRIVKVIYLAAGWDANPTVAALEYMRANFQTWRDEAGADLVAMLTGRVSGIPNVSAGIAYVNGAESVNSIEYFSTFVFTHEIGHNFGCYHDRDNSQTKHAYAHALRVPEQGFRTVMAYACPNNACPTVPYYSAKGYYFRGVPMGDDANDNARMIRETAPAVAAWRNSQTQTPPPPPPPPGPAPTSNPPSCFSSFNTVDVKDVGEIPMNKLKIGDFVKTKNEKFTQVYGFGHYDHDMQQEFIQIILGDDTSKNSIPFEVSSKHLVFVERNNKLYSIPASEIIIGDNLGDYGKKVKAIYTVSRRGVYSPLTETGDLFVNGGILASNYVNILHSSNSILDQHRLGHALVFPQRLLCRYNINICKDETYINGYGFLVYIIIKIGSLINMSGWFCNMIVSLLSKPLVGLVSLLESITMLR